MFGTRYHDAATRGIASGSNGAMIRLFGTAAGADYWFSAHTLAGFALAGGGTIFPVVRGSTGRSDPLKVWAFAGLGANAEGEFSTVTRSYAGKGEVRRA